MVHYQKRFLKIFLTISIVSAIFVFLFFLSTPDSEAVVTQALSPISCVSGSLLGSALAPEIEKMMFIFEWPVTLARDLTIPTLDDEQWNKFCLNKTREDP